MSTDCGQQPGFGNAAGGWEDALIPLLTQVKGKEGTVHLRSLVRAKRGSEVQKLLPSSAGWGVISHGTRGGHCNTHQLVLPQKPGSWVCHFRVAYESQALAGAQASLDILERFVFVVVVIFWCCFFFLPSAKDMWDEWDALTWPTLAPEGVWALKGVSEVRLGLLRVL